MTQNYERPHPELRKERIDTDKEMVQTLRDVVHGMASDFRQDLSSEGTERYSHIFHIVEDRLRRELGNKKADAILIDPKRLDAEVAKELVMRLQREDASVMERRDKGENGEVLLRDLLKDSAQKFAKGEIGHDESVSVVRREAEKRLGMYIAPTDEEIERAVEIPIQL